MSQSTQKASLTLPTFAALAVPISQLNCMISRSRFRRLLPRQPESLQPSAPQLSRKPFAAIRHDRLRLPRQPAFLSHRKLAHNRVTNLAPQRPHPTSELLIRHARLEDSVKRQAIPAIHHPKLIIPDLILAPLRDKYAGRIIERHRIKLLERQRPAIHRLRCVPPEMPALSSIHIRLHKQLPMSPIAIHAAHVTTPARDTGYPRHPLSSSQLSQSPIGRYSFPAFRQSHNTSKASSRVIALPSSCSNPSKLRFRSAPRTHNRR